MGISKFTDTINSGKWIVTTEINPPKGVDLVALRKKVDKLRGLVDAFNITDSAGANMTMAPIAVAHALSVDGVEPILQITGRDRNKIALQAELLASFAMGVTNILCMSGDSPSNGDHPDAKAVLDLDAMGLLQAVEALCSGYDLFKNELSGTPTFVAGAVVNPGARDLDREMERMGSKIDLGASFFQTQAVYETESFERFMNKAQVFGVPVIAGLIVLKSGNMARYLNKHLPGVFVPEGLIAQIDGSDDRVRSSVEISARIIEEVRSMCRGVHIMAMGWETKIPQILKSAGIDNSN